MHIDSLGKARTSGGYRRTTQQLQSQLYSRRSSGSSGTFTCQHCSMAVAVHNNLRPKYDGSPWFQHCFICRRLPGIAAAIGRHITTALCRQWQCALINSGKMTAQRLACWPSSRQPAACQQQQGFASANHTIADKDW